MNPTESYWILLNLIRCKWNIPKSQTPKEKRYQRRKKDHACSHIRRTHILRLKLHDGHSKGSVQRVSPIESQVSLYGLKPLTAAVCVPRSLPHSDKEGGYFFPFASVRERKKRKGKMLRGESWWKKEASRVKIERWPRSFIREERNTSAPLVSG